MRRGSRRVSGGARRHPGSRVAALLVAAALVASGCSALTEPARPSETGIGPQSAIATFAEDWQAGRTHDASSLTTRPAEAALLLSTVGDDLRSTGLRIDTGAVARTSEDRAQVRATLTWTLPVAGSWSYPVDWTWVRSGTGSASRWLLQFSPHIVHPRLGPQQTLAVRRMPASDGPVVDRHDVQLISPVRVHSVVVLVHKITDLTGTAKKLAALLGRFDKTVTAASITAGVRDARTAGRDSYTVINLRDKDFAAVEAELNAVPGIGLPSAIRDLPSEPGFASTLLGSAVPAAQAMAKGRPGWRIVTVDMAGDELDTLAEQPPVPGRKVTLTLDPAVQDAAQATVDPVAEPSVLVAIQPSTGEILAVAQNAAADAQGPIALTGRYPPGSTFKIVTATAAVDRKLITPDTRVHCPGEWTTNHRTIHNEGFALGTVTATTAFARSCNTTFAQLAARMPPDALPQAATQYGIGLDFDIAGITTLTGSIRPGDSVLARAENGFGQGTDLVTPFSAALMAATAATGNMPTPVLIRGTHTTVDRPAPPRSDAARSAIRSMMRAVVTEGTARTLRPAGEVYAKTGTAEYVDTDGKIQAHAWTVGFRGDIAFAALIVGGNSSKRTNEMALTFLRHVGTGGPP